MKPFFYKSFVLCLLWITGVSYPANAAPSKAPPEKDASLSRVGSSTGLPIPRFVSLKSAHINARVGPSQKHDILFVYTQETLPVEIIQEFDNWRRIRDWEGVESWVFHSLVSGKRTAMILPWKDTARISVYERPEETSKILAVLGSKILVFLHECRGAWCLVTYENTSGGDVSGWVEQNTLFGVYAGEVFE